MRRSSHASSAYALRSLAYSSAARTSWIEQGPTTCDEATSASASAGQEVEAKESGTHDEEAVVLALEDGLAALAAVEDSCGSCCAEGESTRRCCEVRRDEEGGAPWKLSG